jgi:3-hydroxyisobutyrate dehydrogenase
VGEVVTALGVIGLGRMGFPICARLIEAGFEVAATDQDPTRRPDAEALGAAWKASAQDVVDCGQVLITVLSGSPEAQELMSALLPSMKRDSTWIDLTSTSPKVGAELRSLAGQLECLDAPMGGGPDEAAAGSLELFVGGRPESVARHRGILETIGRVHHVGGPGAGAVVKHLVNLLWFGQAVATGETLLLAQRMGVDLETLRLALTESAADSRFIRSDLPALLEGDYLPRFGLERCFEELDAIAELAHDLGLPFGLSSFVRDLYAQAVDHFGPRDGELLAVAMLESQAGAALRAPAARPGKEPPCSAPPDDDSSP